MWRLSRIFCVALVILAAGAGTGTAQLGRHLGVIAVSCRDANLREPNGVQQRVILGVVSVPSVYTPQVVRNPEDGWTYWSKAGISIQAGSRPVRISVPRAWRKRFAISWGVGGPLSEERFEPCSPPPTYWSGFAGGFYLNARSACVPLIFQVGEKSTTVRFGIGRRCS
jgi:hypothetical protein